jgi:hypothetical protein
MNELGEDLGVDHAEPDSLLKVRTRFGEPTDLRDEEGLILALILSLAACKRAAHLPGSEGSIDARGAKMSEDGAGADNGR